MPYREFVHEGNEWMVWSTHPRSGANVRLRYAGGWLTFQRGTERRRLAPIPPHWESVQVDQLCAWVKAAEPMQAGEPDSAPEPDLPDPHSFVGPEKTREVLYRTTALRERTTDAVDRIRDLLRSIRHPDHDE